MKKREKRKTKHIWWKFHEGKKYLSWKAVFVISLISIFVSQMLTSVISLFLIYTLGIAPAIFFVPVSLVFFTAIYIKILVSFDYVRWVKK